MLPDGFDPQMIMELGENPGLGMRELHKRGITGWAVPYVQGCMHWRARSNLISHRKNYGKKRLRRVPPCAVTTAAAMQQGG